MRIVKQFLDMIVLQDLTKVYFRDDKIESCPYNYLFMCVFIIRATSTHTILSLMCLFWIWHLCLLQKLNDLQLSTIKYDYYLCLWSLVCASVVLLLLLILLCKKKNEWYILYKLSFVCCWRDAKCTPWWW